MTDRAIFARLKSLPPWKEAVARYRLGLIRGWGQLSRQHVRRKRHSSRMTKQRYCALRGVNYKTFLKWQLNFRRQGIDGIIPKYGQHRAGQGKYEKEISWINSALLGPARTVKELHAELSSICKAKKLEVPPNHALRRILNNTGLRDLLVEGHGAKSWIKISRSQDIIEVDLRRPMACIERMEKRLRTHADGQVLIQLMKLRLENYIVNRRREELHSLTQR